MNGLIAMMMGQLAIAQAQEEKMAENLKLVQKKQEQNIGMLVSILVKRRKS